jgi:glucokinase
MTEQPLTEDRVREIARAELAKAKPHLRHWYDWAGAILATAVLILATMGGLYVVYLYILAKMGRL